MVALFEQPKAPPFYGSNHLLIFSILWPKLWQKAIAKVGLEKAGPYCKDFYADTFYQWIKNGNFAVQYGAVDKEDGTGTADRAYHQPGAQAKIKGRFKKLTALNDYWIRFAEEHGYVETMPDKSVDPTRGYPLMCTRTSWDTILPTVPLNYHVQGTACYWMLKAMIRCQAQLDKWNRKVGASIRNPKGGYFMVMQVHDELVFSMPRGAKDNVPKVRKLMSLMAEGGNDIGLPTPVSCKFHDTSWAHGMSL
jgi:predicted Rdx family selenoprotein